MATTDQLGPTTIPIGGVSLSDDKMSFLHAAPGQDASSATGASNGNVMADQTTKPTMPAHLTASVEQNTVLSANDISMALAGSHGALDLATPTATALDAVIKFHVHKEGPTVIPLSQGIVLEFVGAALTFIPGILH
jgi:hypothetical protein